MLQQAKRPLLYVGGGVIMGDASTELRQFADRYGIPVTTTLMGIGAVDTTEDLSLHMLACTARPAPIMQWKIVIS